MTPEIIAALEDARRAGRPIVLGTSLPDGAQRLLPDPAAPAELNEAARAAARRGRNPHRQARRQRLVPARLQPAAAPDRRRRRAYRPGAGALRRRHAASPSPWSIRAAPSPPTSVSPTSPSPPTGPTRRWTALRPDVRTAVVTLTHDPKLDDPALDRALKSPAFYIGALGSRKTHAARLKRLRALGHYRPGDGAHPRPGRAEHRGGDSAGDRAVDHRRGGRRAPWLAAGPEGSGMTPPA